VAGSEREVPATWVFVFIGASPRTDWLGDDVARDDKGFVITGHDLLNREEGPRWRLSRAPFALETSVPGVFAAGDVRLDSMKRVASAVGEGAMAVYLVHRYLATI
jgi:thioredoxin reductase (NADPH)